MTLSIFEAALLADDVYQAETASDGEVQPPPCDGFTPQRWEHERASGFTGAIYTRPGGGGEVVLAFAGTNPSSWSDLYADLEIASNQLPGQICAAARLCMVAGELRRGRELVVVGHSLGGGLAQVVTAQFDCRAVTFNAPAMGAHVERFRRATGMGPADESALAQRIVNFRSMLDPVSLGLHALDVVRRAGAAAFGLPVIDTTWARHLGRLHTLGQGSGLHSMTSMVEHLRRRPWSRRSPWDATARFD